ncbi:DUF1638 domain-containing protein [Desulfococcaceae bacterium HSG9]|nr:DUF1638 domain-containing protein [Desulfococcaceae bacterium HSG9]
MNPKPYIIACAVLAHDIKFTAKKLGMDMGVKFLEGGLHDRPNLLREKLQEAIDTVSASGKCDRIVIGYGVCGRGAVGVKARNVPLAIPKVHDCIALFLGGDAAYRKQFKKYPGTYYISAGWYDEKTEPMNQRKLTAYYGEERLNYDQMVENYDKDTADETFRFLNAWQKNYQRAAFIETGAKISPKYEAYAQEMAEEYGWKYEKIDGDHGLIKQLLAASETTAEILVVPPEHVIVFDALRSALTANPVWSENKKSIENPDVTVIEDRTQETDGDRRLKIGLGIDAGGTYTDTVIYDLAGRKTLCKSKALTTKWDFTLGIHEALAKLDQDLLGRVEMAALSTTLATNAIVEGEGQKVGMIIMPAYGRLDSDEISHTPKAAVSGQLEISGVEICPVNETEVKLTVRKMIKEDKVKAFAVSGYAGAVNPAHEMTVKRIIREETGLSVTCGHELSGILNFKTRAYTAMLNARILPKLAKLISELEKVLGSLGIIAPIVVVKGDGTLMSADMAKERPVETVLSGPAASVAGARHLTGLKDALVADMGGTTTDTAALADGAVSVCESGSDVGGQKTHVKALEIRTAGLGGDSLIHWEKGCFSIGPRRVAPIAWMGAQYPGANRALSYLDMRIDRYTVSTKPMQILALTGVADILELTSKEKAVVSHLTTRPYSVDELVKRLDVLFESGLELARLEENHIIQRCGLTLTDLLCVTGRFERWDKDAAAAYCDMFARLTKTEAGVMAERLLKTGVERLALEILKRQLDGETDPQALHTCPVCQTLVKNMLSGGNDQYAVRIDLKRPIVGIGAPIHFFLPKAAEALGAEAIIPKDADVANAIGAITSDVVIRRHIRINPDHEGGFLIEGLAGAPRFERFEDADTAGREKLAALVIELARTAGTGANRVRFKTEDILSSSADGSQLFLGRVIHATLTGQPDMILNESSVSVAEIAN